MKTSKNSPNILAPTKASTAVGIDQAKNAARRFRWDAGPQPSKAERHRIEHIHKVLRRAWARGNRELPNATDLAAELKVTRQTIYSTIWNMQNDHGMPVETLPGGAGYRYTEEVVSTPFCQLSESEVLAVYLSHEMLRSFHKMPLKKRAQSAFRKIIEQAGSSLSFDAAMVEDAFSITPSGHPAYFHPRHFEICSQAVLEREELLIDYTKVHGVGAGVPELRRVRPLHLAFYEFAWYLLSWDYKSKKMRCFMLTRMNALKKLGEHFARPKRFNPKAILRRNFAIYTSGKKENIALEFSPAVARRVQEHEWHKTQKFFPRTNHGVGMTLRVAITPDLVAWIASFLDDCRIVEPLDLREDVARRQRRAAEGHGRGTEGW